MEPKKNVKVDLERSKSLFFKFGLVLALASTLFAFEWKNTEKEVKLEIVTYDGGIDIVAIPITRPKPEPVEAITNNTTLKLIPNNSIEVDSNPFEFGLDDVINGGSEYNKIVDTPEESKKDITDVIHVVVDFNAEFPGGESEMLRFFSKNITYPTDERNFGIEGTTFVSFVIEKNGTVSRIGIERPLSPGLDNEAMRVISKMPSWKPGNFHGKIVRQKFIVPFKFSLK